MSCFAPCRARCSRRAQAQRPSRAASCHFQLRDPADTGDLFRGKHLVQFTQVSLQIVEILALRPVIRMRIQVSEIPAVGLLPVGELRFHHETTMHIEPVNASRSFWLTFKDRVGRLPPFAVVTGRPSSGIPPPARGQT